VHTFISDQKVRKMVIAEKNFRRLGRITEHLLGISTLKGRRGRPKRRRRRRSVRRRSSLLDISFVEVF
jgi:hypothetical protein